MRILAIRGANLASLADAFEIDLAAEPLASAGLFAITGATGAGKSTLLDAMCAALFDRTPRLEGRSRFKLDYAEAGEVGAFDVRSLLRRTAASGWAEVDFEGRDRRRYRARWSVRRAYDRADRALKDQEMSLVRLDDGARLGGTRRETQRAIEDALGLSFDQFRRSALLAQGDFAAFLRADPSERAGLLERMTGTALYGDLSIAAYRRGADLAAERRTLVAVRDATAVLTADAAHSLDEELVAASAAVGQAHADVAAVAAATAWRERRDALAAAQREAAAAAAATHVAVDRLAQLSAGLVRHDQLAAARGPWTTWRDAAAQVDAAVEAAAGARGAAEAAAVEAERARGARHVADAGVAAARQAQAASADELAQARRLDDALATARQRASETADALVQATARAAQHAAAQAARADELAEVERARLAAEAAAAAEPLAAAVALAWERLDAALEELATGAGEVAAARARLDAIVPALLEAEQASQAALAARADAAATVEIARQAYAGAEARAQEAPLDQAQVVLDERERRAVRLTALVELATTAAATTAAWTTARAEAEAAAAAAARLAEEEAAAAAAHRAEQAALAEAEATAARLRQATGLDGLRAALVDGEPCVVCGATSHPWRHDAVIDALVSDQDARVGALRARVDQLAAAVRAGAVAAGVERGRAAASGAEATRLAARRSREAAAWLTGLREAGELPLMASPDAPTALAWASEAAAAAVRLRDRARAARDGAAAAARAATEAHAKVLAASHVLDGARATADQARAAVDQLTMARIEAERGRDLAGQAAGAARVTVEGIVPATTHAALADPVALRAQLAAGVVRFRTATAAAAAAARRGDTLRAAHASAAVAGADLEVAAADAATVDARQRAQVDQLAAARAALLGGEEVAAREVALAAASTAATDRAAAATAAAELAATTHARAAAHVDAATAAAARATAARDRARAALDAALGAAGCDEATAADVFARPAAQVAAERDEVAAATRAAVTAAAQVDQLAAQRAALEAARPAHPHLELDAATWAATVAAAAAAAETAGERQALLAARRRADATARAQRRAAEVALAAFETRAAPFEQLAALIGSADGKRLRDFAQSLTLEALVRAANHHLDELAPRYQLARVPRRDLELQVVDREMGDEIRSLASLSGGESFLASLALALGLSSMSAGGATVRTLLVDEGFGTLDPQTLETALAALDALRATGRQVGIVSHLPGLDERVGATVQVRPVGGGKSVVTVSGPRG